METRANYVLIGVFTLAVVAGVFGFIYWFQNIGGTGERLRYRIVFDGSVSGLRTGASVLFNGIRVGEVTGLQLDPSKPKQVVATLSVDKSVTVRADTQIGLEFQGLTGIASVSLIGGNPSAKVVAGVGAGETPPLMVAPPGATQDVTQAARDIMRKVDDFITQNQESFKAALTNIEKFTAALSNNSDKIDKTLSNIERFTAALGSNSDSIDKTLSNIERFTGALGRNSDRIDRIAQGLEGLTGGPDGKGGDINAAARSIKTLADNLDKRTEALTLDIARLAKTGTRTLSTIDKAAKNFDENPSRLIWGGSSSDQKQPRTPAVR
ncbi:MlaD family protein [Undibacter mobilis]|uniref:MCE family protein n=1 Tax=Undibacter mobilis TaxID=2292256 RepID=A0A371BCK5_9BRAD|nr:MlaD family protein [Undibacter mobilis]RDV05153.1 MCE family protein [Undibacter mobilis]